MFYEGKSNNSYFKKTLTFKKTINTIKKDIKGGFLIT